MPVLDASSFAIGFDPRDREALHRLWDEVIDSQQWTEGRLTERFEEAWERWNGIGAVATAGWSGAALAALDFAGVRGQTVLCPSNTFPATPLAALAAGARVEFVDCNRHDLCASFEHFEQQALRHKPRAAFVVHIGGHIAFDIERIAAFCRDQGIFLIEDCAHAHGADWNGRRPAPSATPASTPCTRQRRSRPVKAASLCPMTRICWSTPALTATTASPTSRSRGSGSG